MQGVQPTRLAVRVRLVYCRNRNFVHEIQLMASTPDTEERARALAHARFLHAHLPAAFDTSHFCRTI
jgi:hypothetical protein